MFLEYSPFLPTIHHIVAGMSDQELLTLVRRNRIVEALTKHQLGTCTKTGLANTPINGMLHLAYLGQMLESGMGLVIPKELVLSWDCPNPF